MNKEKIVNFPTTIVGKVIGEKDKYVEIDQMTFDEMGIFLKEVARFDYKFNRGDKMVCVEAKIAGKSMFVDISENQYMRLCDLYFKEKIEDREQDI